MYKAQKEVWSREVLLFQDNKGQYNNNMYLIVTQQTCTVHTVGWVLQILYKDELHTHHVLKELKRSVAETDF